MRTMVLPVCSGSRRDRVQAFLKLIAEPLHLRTENNALSTTGGPAMNAAGDLAVRICHPDEFVERPHRRLRIGDQALVGAETDVGAGVESEVEEQRGTRPPEERGGVVRIHTRSVVL